MCWQLPLILSLDVEESSRSTSISDRSGNAPVRTCIYEVGGLGYETGRCCEPVRGKQACQANSVISSGHLCRNLLS
jgi:hypothetical protein